MASVKVVTDPQALAELLVRNPELRAIFSSVGEQVKSAAEATAQAAQNGPGGTLHDYAEAGFTVKWEARGRRPRVVISSNADPEMALRVHFYTQKRDGVAHLRAALRSVT